MQLQKQEMTKERILQVLTWRYEPPYDFYNVELSDETMKEMLENTYYAVVNEKDEFVGFYCIGEAAQVPAGKEVGAYSEDGIDIGIGMHPKLTGQGKGSNFFSFILNHITEVDLNKPLRLTVAAFNERAIRLYEKYGFQKKAVFHKGDTEFITMKKVED